MGLTKQVGDPARIWAAAFFLMVISMGMGSIFSRAAGGGYGDAAAFRFPFTRMEYSSGEGYRGVPLLASGTATVRGENDRNEASVWYTVGCLAAAARLGSLLFDPGSRGAGKTTLLRDLIRQISDGKGSAVAAAQVDCRG